jgi:cobalamin biosynthesis Mg chelatase CobN
MHRALRPTRSLLLALPLLALALTLFTPSAAFACGGSSSEVIYCSGAPNLESGESIKHSEKPTTTHHHVKPTTHHSSAPTTGEERTDKKTGHEAEPKTSEGHHSHAAAPTKGGNHPGGGKPEGHAASKHPNAAEPGAGKNAAPKSSEGPTTKGVPASASTGGSSPVLPIIVAIVVLAAISIGVVVYRDRKGGDGQTGHTAQG